MKIKINKSQICDEQASLSSLFAIHLKPKWHKLNEHKSLSLLDKECKCSLELPKTWSSLKKKKKKVTKLKREKCMYLETWNVVIEDIQSF